MKKTKFLTIVLAIVMLAAMFQIPSFAAYNSSNPPVVKNVSFFSGGDEIFEVPEAGAYVSAKVYLKNTTAQTVTVILASYADNTLENLVVSPETSIIVGYPTVTSSSVKITENTDRISVCVWSDMQYLTPVTRSSVLGEESGNAKLASYSVTLTDGSISKVFNGDINHDEKTVDVYVPTIDIKSAGLTDVGTGEKADGAEGYSSTFSDANFANAIKTASFAVTTEDENATVIANGTADFSTAQTVTVTALNGNTSTYTVAVHPIGYVINSNFDSTKLRYVASEITVKDTENAWKYEANNFTSVTTDRGLTPAPASSTGYWLYNPNNIVIKDGWRYTKSDYEATGVKASDTLYYSRIYADLSKSTTDDSDHHIDVVTNNIRTGIGTASEQAKLIYTYARNNSHKGLNAITGNLNTSIASFDFTMKEGTEGSGLLYNSGIGDFAVRLHSGDTGLYKIDARAHYSDSAFNGKTSTLYTTLNLNGYEVGEWHNVKMIAKDMGSFVNGKKLIHTAYYIDGEYAGYTYSADKFTSLWANYVTDYPGFQAFNNAECTFAFDNYFTGYCYK